MMNDCINDYRIMELLGEGAFGKVYKAIGVDRKQYALKIIPITQKVKDKIREQGRLLASMEHPNILWAREFFYYQQEKYFVIITQFCNNGGLDNYIGNLDLTKTLSIMKGIAQGLLYLHQEKQIVHRDLKPENILLNNWVPKIADMGVAKMLKTYQVTTKIGTPTYMAFEMLEGDYSIEVDIWALGIIYIEMILGKRIYELIKGEQIPAKRASFPSEDLLNQIQDEKMRKLVREMLKKSPKERITIQEVLMYFDITQLRVSRSRNSVNEQKKRKQGFSEIISDCYTKTEEYWYNKYPLTFIKQLYQKYMVEIVGQAQQNNKKAIFLLAKMYEYGFGMIKNAEKSQQLLLKCYELQQPHSCFELYLTCTSSTEKFQYLMVGKQLEEVRCLYKLAEDYLEGLEGLSIDYQQAEQIIDYLCKKQYPSGYYLRGALYSKKNTEYYNLDQMRLSYKRGGQLGNLGCKILYANDLYKQKKYNQSLQFCKSISIQGQSSIKLKDKLTLSQLQAKCYAKLKNTQKTVEFYYKCLELDNNSLEKDYMGSIAAYLESIKQESKAMEFYSEAINRLLPKYNKSQFCGQRLKSLCQSLYALYYEHKMYKQAYKIAELSAKLNFDNGKADQAYMIYGGAGVDKNESLGLNLLKSLAKEGNTEAVSYLNDIAQSKKCQPQNFTQI